MVVGMSGATDAKYAGSPYPGKPVGQHHGSPDPFIFSDLLDPDTLWSCTTCRACVQACPILLDPVDAIVDILPHPPLTREDIPSHSPKVNPQLPPTRTPPAHH